MSETAFTYLNDDALVRLVAQAQDRVALVAPGVSKEAAWALVAAMRRLGPRRVTVILDVDPEVCRLGFGTAAGLRLLRDEAAAQGVLIGHQSGLRVGVLVADQELLVFSPTPLLLESPPEENATPNAIRLSASHELVIKEIGLGAQREADQIVGLDPVRDETVEELERELEAIPPLPFDLARQVRIYSAHIQFVEFSMTGCNLSRRRLRIPEHLLPVASSETFRAQIHSQVELAFARSLTVKTPEGELSEEILSRKRAAIVKDSLIPIRGYGFVVRKDRKAALEKAVSTLQDQVKSFRTTVEHQLRGHLEQLTAELTKLLLPIVSEALPPSMTKILGSTPSDLELEETLRDEVQALFPSAKQLTDGMEVKLVFKDVTYESLKDPEFLAAARKAMPRLAALHDESLAAGQRGVLD